MTTYQPGDRVEYVGTAWPHRQGMFGTVERIVDEPSGIFVILDDGRSPVECFAQSLRLVAPLVPDVVTIPRNELPEVTDEGNGTFRCGGIGAYKAADAAYCRSRALEYLALAEARDAATLAEAAAEKAAAEKLSKRRDELAREFGQDRAYTYAKVTTSLRLAIDRIIALQDQS